MVSWSCSKREICGTASQVHNTSHSFICYGVLGPLSLGLCFIACKNSHIMRSLVKAWFSLVVAIIRNISLKSYDSYNSYNSVIFIPS